MKIEWYKPEDETIPTELRLKADGETDVWYEKLGEMPGYRFRFLDTQCGMAKAMTITDEIVKILCEQSFDHGSEWVETGRKAGHESFWIFVDVTFRVKDGW